MFCFQGICCSWIYSSRVECVRMGRTKGGDIEDTGRKREGREGGGLWKVENSILMDVSRHEEI